MGGAGAGVGAGVDCRREVDGAGVSAAVADHAVVAVADPCVPLEIQILAFAAAAAESDVALETVEEAGHGIEPAC